MTTIIVCPKGTLELVNKVFKRTESYIKTKVIMKKQYNIEIELQRIEDDKECSQRNC